MTSKSFCVLSFNIARKDLPQPGTLDGGARHGTLWCDLLPGGGRRRRLSGARRGFPQLMPPRIRRRTGSAALVVLGAWVRWMIATTMTTTTNGLPLLAELACPTAQGGQREAAAAAAIQHTAIWHSGSATTEWATASGWRAGPFWSAAGGQLGGKMAAAALSAPSRAGAGGAAPEGPSGGWGGAPRPRPDTDERT